jgi:hypothetical protein
MIIGNPSFFAIESSITQAYERLGFRALGYFVLHIGNMCYGVRESEATMLACAFDEAGRIILNRGNHTTPFAAEPKAGDLLDAFGRALYASDTRGERFSGISKQEFSDYIYSSNCGWHWACDEAFDDGSCILHFDVGDRVRLIADQFTKENSDYIHDPQTLRDVWLEANDFYNIVEEWHKAFEAEWKVASKISQLEDGAEN